MISREDYKHKKQVEEARKAGTLPPEKDADGNLINPHIPEFMAKAPWYLNQTGPGLAHQRKSEAAKKEFGFSTYYKRGEFVGQATKYRKGACKNCGSMTHQEKDCTERPRKVGAWKTNKNIAPDEVVHSEVDVDWDTKRDRYNGYDPDEHAQTIAKFQATEEERKRIRAEQREKEIGEKKAKKAAERAKRQERRAAKTAAGGDTQEDSDSASETDTDTDYSSARDSDDDVRQRDDLAVVATDLVSNTKTKATVRNLRLREDTAKYLYNLDPDSAYYDPKTRSMRENPNPEKGPTEAVYRGDNAWRQSGAVREVAEAEVFAWNAAEHGTEVNAMATPTQVALLKQQFNERKDKRKEIEHQKILERYGVAEDVKPPPKELIFGQAEGYVEYTRDGRVLKGASAPIAKSRYEEDVYPGNHTSVFGSWFDLHNKQWGYACCHATMLNSYCTGSAGIEARSTAATGAEERAMSQRPLEWTDTATAASAESHKSGSLYGEVTDPTLDPKKMKAALERYEAQQEELRLRAADLANDRKRQYNSLQGTEVNMSAEDMEVYKLKRTRSDDPMAEFLSQN